MTYCTRCGGEANELILLGAVETIYTCNGCGANHIGRPERDKCGRCGHVGGFTPQRKVEDHERLPAQDICDKCKEEIKSFHEEVERGGVFWKCKDCKKEGVMKATAQYSILVRKAMKIEAPAKCGVEFDKETCPVCGPKPVVGGKKVSVEG